MSYLTLKIENQDIVMNKDNQLQLTEPDDIEQNYLVYLSTQYGSDFRDGDYGFKLEELITSEFTNKLDLIELYTIESLLQHPRTESVDEVIVEEIGNGKYSVQARLTLTNEEKLELGVELAL